MTAAAGAVRRLAAQVAVPVRVRREGATVAATADDLVSGDVIELRPGDAVPADCRVVAASGLELDEDACLR